MKKTKQLVLRLSPELMKTIDDALSAYLKRKGIPTTKAEFVRDILETQCNKIIGNK